MSNETELIYGSEGTVRTEKVIERVVVVKELYTNLPRQQIGILGLCPGAGATFVTLALAAAVERMGIRAGIKEVYDNAISDMTGEAAARFDTEQAPVMLYDFSGTGGNEALTAEIKKMDKVILVVDPLPSKIVRGYERFCRLKTAAVDLVFVINKMQREVRKKEVKEIFACREIFEIPFISPQYIYTAEKKSILAADICFVRKDIEPMVKKIFPKILPNEILKLT